MRDEETGTWWQQVTGEAILGPLKGRFLKAVYHDELSFGLWKLEKPNGRVLRPEEKIVAAKEYAPADWEQRMTRARVVEGADTDHRLEPRTLVVGITLQNRSTAYPFSALQKQSPIMDDIGRTSILVALGPDNRSVRAFERTLDGRKLEFFEKTEGTGWQLVDAETGSVWNFEGKATAGPLKGSQLKRIKVLEDYWFDWRIYHPDTAIYGIGPQ